MDLIKETDRNANDKMYEVNEYIKSNYEGSVGDAMEATFKLDR